MQARHAACGEGCATQRPAIGRGPGGYRTWRRRLQDAAALLIELDGLEQCLEITFTKTVIALALNDFKKDRADCVLGEDLQQDPALVAAVDQNPTALKRGHGFTMADYPGVDPFEIGRGRLLEFNAAGAQRIHRLVNIVGAQGDMLNAFTLVFV